MNLPNTLTMPQIILISSLFTLLISWLVIFAYLALRSTPEKRVEQMEHTATLSVIKAPITRTLTITPSAQSRDNITQSTPIVTLSTDSTREIVLDHSKH